MIERDGRNVWLMLLCVRVAFRKCVSCLPLSEALCDPSSVNGHEFCYECLHVKDWLRSLMHAMVIEGGFGDDLILDLIVDALQQHLGQAAHDHVGRDALGQ